MTPKIIDFSASSYSTRFEDKIEFKWKTSNTEFVRINFCKEPLPAQGGIKLSLKENIESEKIEVSIKAYGSYYTDEVVEESIIIKNEIYKNIIANNTTASFSSSESVGKWMISRFSWPILAGLTSLFIVSVLYFKTGKEITNEEIRNKIISAYVDLGGPEVGTYSSYIDQLCNTDSLKINVYKLIDINSVSTERFNEVVDNLCSSTKSNQQEIEKNN